MSRRVVLHIGAMKSGTSFVQSTLRRRRPALAREGWTYPRASIDEVRAGLGRGRPGGVPDPEPWRALTAVEGDLVVSMEFLSFARPAHLDDFLAPFADDDVTVVMGVRDQVRSLPSQWQTWCRSRGTLDWPDYLAALRGEGEGQVAADVHAAHTRVRAPAVLRRWSAHPAVDRVAVVTVPAAAEPAELWRRFVAASGLPPVEVDLERARPNARIGYGSTELLRRVNGHLPDVGYGEYRRAVKALWDEVLAPRSDAESRIVLDRPATEAAHRANAVVRDVLADPGAGLVLHGDLGDLPVTGEPAVEVAGPPPAGEVLAAGEAALAWLGEDARADPRATDARELAARVAAGLRRRHGW
ncbi:hypothetical protein [uncultured Nocardioides sp.]|uniref:hypothetical protein n=1 Tax=uncultured Nocardioides sp. TaxID=198441 RepID=UPI0026386BE1|nr:hypothetical protein [uncultured Nocardioides sp.]